MFYTIKYVQFDFNTCIIAFFNGKMCFYGIAISSMLLLLFCNSCAVRDCQLIILLGTLEETPHVL